MQTAGMPVTRSPNISANGTVTAMPYSSHQFPGPLSDLIISSLLQYVPATSGTAPPRSITTVLGGAVPAMARRLSFPKVMVVPLGAIFYTGNLLQTRE